MRTHVQESVPSHSGADLRVAHVLCVDVVQYTLLSLSEQVRVRSVLSEVLKDLPIEGALIIDTGDGFAAVFENDPTGPLSCSRKLKSRLAEANFKIRIGIHSGPILYQPGITGQSNATGPGINFAQRVMSLADPGMILLTAVAADLIRQLEPGVSLTEFGEAPVKHEKSLRVFALNSSEGIQEAIPTKFTTKLRKPRSNLPSLERDFAGRRTELELMRKLLSEDQRRLVTLTGPGGIGKSTVAIKLGQMLEPEYADGVWLVECEDLQTPEQLIPLMCSILGAGATNLPELLDYLNDRQVLVILDCLERISTCGPMLDDLLRDTREMQIIATSRVLLSTRRETEVVLGPIDTEPHDGAPSDAIKLFCDAATQASPNFSVNPRTRKHVDRIIASTEGVPIHMVLAAGKLRYMSVSELADRLAESRLDTLKRKAVGQDRHSSSLTVVEDSVKLLGKEEQELLLGLSVFKGGFYLVDAATVLSTFEDVELGIDELRNNSLLNGTVVHGRTRFRSLDLVAEYAERKVDPEWIAPLDRLHADYFSTRSQQVRSAFDMGAWNQVQAVFWTDLASRISHRDIRVNLLTTTPGSIRFL